MRYALTDPPPPAPRGGGVVHDSISVEYTGLEREIMIFASQALYRVT